MHACCILAKAKHACRHPLGPRLDAAEPRFHALMITLLPGRSIIRVTMGVSISRIIAFKGLQ